MPAAGRFPDGEHDRQRREAAGARQSAGSVQPIIPPPRRRAGRALDLVREVAPELLVQRRKGRMHARADELARPRDRHVVALGDARARTLRQQIDDVRETERLFQIVGHQQHADALPLDQPDHVLDDAGAHDGVERGERLVHQDQLRLQRQHLRERDALALPAAQVAREPVAEAGKPEPVEPRVGLRRAPSRAPCRERSGRARHCRAPCCQGKSASSWNSMPTSARRARPRSCRQAVPAGRSPRAAGSTCRSPTGRPG